MMGLPCVAAGQSVFGDIAEGVDVDGGFLVFVGHLGGQVYFGFLLARAVVFDMAPAQFGIELAVADVFQFDEHSCLQVQVSHFEEPAVGLVEVLAGLSVVGDVTEGVDVDGGTA